MYINGIVVRLSASRASHFKISRSRAANTSASTSRRASRKFASRLADGLFPITKRSRNQRDGEMRRTVRLARIFANSVQLFAGFLTNPAHKISPRRFAGRVGGKHAASGVENDSATSTNGAPTGIIVRI